MGSTSDYGYPAKVQSDLQRSADSAVLAAMQDLPPAPEGSQDLKSVHSSVHRYVTSNVDASFHVRDSNIDVGRYDPTTIYSNVSLLNDGTFDTVRVTLRRDSTANSPVSLFFAPVPGILESEVSATATATLVKPTLMSRP